MNDRRSSVYPARRDDTLRLLPRSSGGKRGILSTDVPGSRAAAIADLMEEAQIYAAKTTLDRAQALMNDRDACTGELRVALGSLLDAMNDVLLIADSRGARLPDPDQAPSDDDAGDG